MTLARIRFPFVVYVICEEDPARIRHCQSQKRWGPSYVKSCEVVCLRLHCTDQKKIGKGVAGR
ncbi:uncharacterized protein L969DRAFT_89592 [Mixia osmundae IAM 14324]|uniref:uncharacterized protein n=1 Tax=Mixia osmundae (strain CBS 9802 / IAM 14324 / JCM 22182 / KY 12970) TaxID=764103 RepID=UPI0004A54AF5|nr:uncharacterized protein L969DRAFT_89592 [Mixia osmundae IAM 14324]KEI37637.1 hypothetical protein L969DRAFT_89592 [Mixia osmundae IAM 14324]